MPADVTGVAQGPTIRAVLFDIDGPIDTEATLGRQLDVDIRAELTAEGLRRMLGYFLYYSDMEHASARPGGPPAMAFEDYDDNYPRAFARLTEAIHEVLPTARVVHVGSTSVRGLGGRRVLDVVMSSPPENHAKMCAALAKIGFSDFPWAHVKTMLMGSVHFDGKDYPVLLYLLPEDHEYVKGWIAFREFMKRHPDEVERYANVKRTAIAQGKTQPWTYQQAKTPYLEDPWKQVEGGSPGRSP